MSDVLRDSQELYNEALEAHAEQRRQIEEDMRFSDPSNPEQWEESVKMLREQDPGGRRPCLVCDQTGQYVANVAGQIEQRPPAIHAIPVSGGAVKDAAEQIDGRFRHIEHASRAAQHYARVLTSAARAGVGYMVVRAEYVDRALGWQEPRISSEPDPLKVVLDPWSVETDGSDANYGFILNPISVAEFERRWPKKDQCDFGDLQMRRQDNRKSVLVAEQWFKEQKTRNMVVIVGADGNEQALTEEEFWVEFQAQRIPEQADQPRSYLDKSMVVRWRLMSGADTLQESEYQSDSIGLVPVYGYVGFKDGRMTYCGIPRRARGAQQAYNYHKSELMMPGAQLMASKRALKGVEPIWDRSNSQRRAFLPYNDMDDHGAIQQPALIKTGSNLVDHVGGAESALRDIQASIGMYQANLGAQSNETSGVAIENRKQQGEASTAHFPAHMAASLGQVGKIVMEMDARLTDTRRKQPIIGVDESPGSVTVNPDQAEAFQRDADGAASINPKVGKYSVRVVVGSSYSTQRSQTNAAFADIMRGNPELAPTVAPFWAQTLDFPGSDKFAQAMAAMAPPPVKAILQPEGQQKQADPAAMAKQIEDMKKALDEAIQHAKEAQDDADQAIADVAEAKRNAAVKERELDIKAYEAETKRLQVTGANEAQIQAVVASTVNNMLMNPDPLPGDPEPMQAAQQPPMPDQVQPQQPPAEQMPPDAPPEPIQDMGQTQPDQPPMQDQGMQP